ncbi:DEAD/DEAH box helicase [Pseudanabaena sp. FACHB-2040]|uniref:DEAD/DEAH box helicase n=1 Tax=Pseudanabaena sp. FACHB-2040 TaxID=2692859 RepID=UPI001689F9DD|nr:DEAD/DEAH box helicase [Pseudanabaena sp. FACHB-2040]MBD2259780.1 DEAD/DEAH box helicase [Pseudanabaena sp. FACHB-2040]
MTILHGSWLPERQQFFLWGEAWQRTETQSFPAAAGVYEHPYSLAQIDLAAWLKAQAQRESNGEGVTASGLVLPGGILAGLTPEVAPPEPAKRRRGKAPATSTAPVTAQPITYPWVKMPLVLPTGLEKGYLQPIHSAAAEFPSALYPWWVSGWLVPPPVALTILLKLPLGQSVGEAASNLGSDLRYWGHVARWGLDLLARGKVLPAIALTSQRQEAFWQPLLDSAVDQDRLRQFARRMPASCLSVCRGGDGSSDHPDVQGPFVELLPPPEDLLLQFLSQIIDSRVRTTAKTQPVPATTPLSRELPVREWLSALSNPNPVLEASPATTSRLRDALATWTAPLQNQTEQTAQFRTRFVLSPPQQQGGDWHLAYALQSVVDPDWSVSAELIWQHPVDQFQIRGQTIESPQETLLGGLGRAARLYEPIRQSLLGQQPAGCALDPIQAYEFIRAVVWRLQDNGFSVELPAGLTGQASSLDSRIGLKIKAEVPGRGQRLGLKSLLNFQWELSLAGETLTKADFEGLLAQRSPLVEINGKWVELRPQEVKAAQVFLTSRKTETPLSVEDALRISTGDTQVIDKLPVVSFEASGALQALIDTLTTGNQTLAPLTEPDGFKGQLRPYQARGVAWLAFLEQWGLGACLADDMGLGKTIQLIAFLLHLRQEGFLNSPTVLVCPTSVLGNWEREVKRFAPDLKTLVHHGDKRFRGAALLRSIKSVQLVITSYPLVFRDLKDLQAVAWQGIVLDEAQNIKNPEAKQAKAVRQLEGQFRIALTGTPVENRLGELWSILDFLNPGYLGPRNFFQRRFAAPIEKYGDTASLQMLRSLVQPFILRRLKTDRDIIQDLPEKQEMTVFCGLSAEQAALYQKTVDQSLEALNEAEGVQRRGQILALLTRLKQICNHPAQFLQEDSLGGLTRSGKLQRLNEMVEEMLSEGDRALIFTQFAEWGKLLKAHLEHHFREESLFLYGSTSKQQRETMVDRFQLDPNGPRLFILSLKAGGVGLNLTRANHVFHFDRWWNPAVENQATDRAFRIGQTRNVQVHKFVCTGTLEERIHEMIESKQALSEQVVGAGEAWLTELGTDQLRNLLLLDRSAVIDDE